MLPVLWVVLVLAPRGRGDTLVRTVEAGRVQATGDMESRVRCRACRMASSCAAVSLSDPSSLNASLLLLLPLPLPELDAD